MAERLVTRIEFIKKSYLRHLETGETPDLEDLVHQTPHRYLKDFWSFVFETYLEKGRVGDYPSCPDIQKITDNLWGGMESLSDRQFRKLMRDLDPNRPNLRVLKKGET